MSRSVPILVALMAWGWAVEARAQPVGGAPYGFSSGTALNMTRPGVPGRCRVAPAPLAQRPVQDTGAVAAGSSDGLACFGWGSILRISCSTDTKIAFVQSSSVTFGSSVDPYALIDAEGSSAEGPVGPSGPAPQAARILDDTWLHVIAGQGPWISPRTPTYRARSCDGGNMGTFGHPCNADADCGTGGACAGLLRAECVFLLLEAETTAGVCHVCEER